LLVFSLAKKKALIPSLLFDEKSKNINVLMETVVVLYAQKLFCNILGILYLLKIYRMSDENKLAILSAISSDSTPGIPARFSFNSLTKRLNLSKQDIDTLLVELNKNRFITQYAKKGVDGFTVVLNQKGLDAVMDGSFI
jgi:hypothetical protein